MRRAVGNSGRYFTGMRSGLISVIVLVGCGAATPAPTPLTPGAVFRSTGTSFAAGPLEVIQRDLVPGEAGAPLPVRLFAPRDSGTYPVVQFQHGFLTDRRAMDEVLTQLASHGFVVVAPQMYPADGVPLGKEAAADEAKDAVALATWSHDVAATVMGSAADPRPLGLAGHSRGGKVSWLAAQQGLAVRGLVGVDPVDGRGGPLLSAQPEALAGAVEGLPPSLVIGMEKGGSCAPEGDNFRHFFERTTPPTTLVVVLGHGHADMLDPDVGTDGLCFSGPERAAVRTLTAGLMTAFFRGVLQDDASTAVELSVPSVAPLEVTREAR